VLLNRGNAVFSAVEHFDARGDAFRVAAADFDLNGLLDLAAANGYSNTVAVFENLTTPALAADCNLNSVPDACELADGSAPDLNANGVPDECDPDCNLNEIPDDLDIAAARSTDCDLNRVPDECQPDCNGNQRADACDIAAGTSPDLNANGIPDECEGGPQRPGDANQDGRVDLSDAVWLLGHLFVGTNPKLPCEGETAAGPGPGELLLLDHNGDGRLDLSDPVGVLGYLFVGGRTPALGVECVLIVGCEKACGG